jgi:hypothetical protein
MFIMIIIIIIIIIIITATPTVSVLSSYVQVYLSVYPST